MLSTPPPAVMIDPLECRLIQEEEIDSLRAIFDADLTPLNDDATCFSINIRYLTDDIKEEDVIKIWFRYVNYSIVYPCECVCLRYLTCITCSTCTCSTCITCTCLYILNVCVLTGLEFQASLCLL